MRGSTRVSLYMRTGNAFIFTRLDIKASVGSSVDEIHGGRSGKRCPLEVALGEGLVGWRVSLGQMMLSLAMKVTASRLVKGGMAGGGGS